MNQQQQQPEPFTLQQRLPEEFSQGDAIQLQRYNAGLSEAQRQIDEGILTPEDGEVFKQVILHKRKPYLERQNAQKELVRNHAVHEIQQDAAMAQGIQHQDAVFRARGLQERVTPVTNPRTGETAFLYESSPNKWEQIQFGGGEGAGQTGQQFGGQRGTAGLEGMTASRNELTPPNPDIGGPVPQDGTVPQPAGPGTAPQAPTQRLVPNQWGGNTLEIWNGRTRELAHFDGSGNIAGREFFDADGNQIQPDSQQQMGMEDEPISPAQKRSWRVEAEKQFPPVDPSIYPQTPHGQLAYANDIRQREMAVSQTASAWENSYRIDRRDRRRAELSQRNFEERDQLIRQREQDRVIKDTKSKDYESSLGRFADRANAMADKLANDLEFGGKPWEERLAEAERRLGIMGMKRPTDPNATEEPTAKAETKPGAKGSAPEQQKAQAEAMQKLHAMTAGLSVPTTPAPSSAKPSPGATQTGPATEKVRVPHGGHLLGLGEQPLGSDNPAEVKPERVKELLKISRDRWNKGYVGYSLTREGASLSQLVGLLSRSDREGKFTEADKKRYKRLLEDLGTLDVRGQLELE